MWYTWSICRHKPNSSKKGRCDLTWSLWHFRSRCIVPYFSLHRINVWYWTWPSQQIHISISRSPLQNCVQSGEISDALKDIKLPIPEDNDKVIILSHFSRLLVVWSMKIKWIEKPLRLVVNIYMWWDCESSMPLYLCYKCGMLFPAVLELTSHSTPLRFWVKNPRLDDTKGVNIDIPHIYQMIDHRGILGPLAKQYLGM